MDGLKKITLFALVIVANMSHAQDFLSIAVPESKWINSYFAKIEKEDDNQVKTVERRLVTAEEFCVTKQDSMINDLRYKVVDNCNSTYIGSIRDHKGKVFFVPRGYVKATVIYDFNAKVGDVVKDVLARSVNGKYVQQDVAITSVDSILIDGAYRRRINYDGGSWIEGIGNTQGLFMSRVKTKSDYLEVLTCVSKGNRTIYPNVAKQSCELPRAFKKAMSTFTEVITLKPSEGWFVMKFDRRVDGDQVHMIDSKGRRIKPKMTVSPDRIIVDLSAYKNGNYIIVIKNSENMTLGRMVKI